MNEENQLKGSYKSRIDMQKLGTILQLNMAHISERYFNAKSGLVCLHYSILWNEIFEKLYYKQTVSFPTVTVALLQS